MISNRQSLAQIMDGAYTYCRRGLTSEFFPDTPFQERGGTAGWIPFSVGTLTNGQSDFVIWDARTVAGSGVDVIFDLGADCWLDEVVIHYVKLKGYGCGSGGVSLAVKTAAESRYRPVRSYRIGHNDQGMMGPWLRLAELNVPARYIRLHLEPSGRSLYADSSLGLVGVELLGLPLAEKLAGASQPWIYPWPAEATWRDGFFTFSPETAIIAPGPARFAAERLREEMAARFDLPLRSDSGDGPAIRFDVSSEIGSEAYTLEIRPEGIWIKGDPAGLFYGMHSLLQLVGRVGGELLAPAVSVKDKPLAAIRGLHVYLPSRENIPYFKRLLDVMAGLKLNTVVLEVSGGMRYQTHPEINAAWEKFAREIKSHLDMGRPALLGIRTVRAAGRTRCT